MSISPLLSICIPTYNRSEYLLKCLNSIISQPEFDDRVEIVISDNCSSDNTELVIKDFIYSYPNIKYFRNTKNLVDENHILALKRGTGILRKLSNDTILYKEGSLKYLLELIDKYKNSRPLIYLHNYNNEKDSLVSSLDEFLYAVSFRVTWIGSVCIWDDGLERLKLYSSYADSHLAQVPYLLNESVFRNNVFISNKVIMSSCAVKGKNLTYGLYKVFYDNFLNFIDEYRVKKLICNETYDFVKKGLLIDFFSRWCAIADSRNRDFVFSDENLTKLVKRAYCHEKYYIIFEIKYIYFYFKEILKKVRDRVVKWN